MFLAGVLEQLDLALEHVSKREVHDARFGLMLTDNAVELVLHQIAKEMNSRLKHFPHVESSFAHKEELAEALGRSFDAKLKFARIDQKLTDEHARTIGIMHSYRNEVYHLGLQHEPILPDLAKFYFATACRFLSTYRPRGLSWSSNMKLPERAKKYFQAEKLFFPNFDNFANACRMLETQCAHKKGETIASLADHMEQVVNDADISLGIVAEGIYDGHQQTRDEAIVECQAWPLALTKEGQNFAKQNGWQDGNFSQLVEWLAQNYPLKVKADPVSSWKRQVKRLRSNGNPHTALANYHSFMTVTSHVREMLFESASQVDAEIDRLIDERRGN